MGWNVGMICGLWLLQPNRTVEWLNGGRVMTETKENRKEKKNSNGKK